MGAVSTKLFPHVGQMTSEPRFFIECQNDAEQCTQRWKTAHSPQTRQVIPVAPAGSEFDALHAWQFVIWRSSLAGM
jgi:hypothetical protein